MTVKSVIEPVTHSTISRLTVNNSFKYNQVVHFYFKPGINQIKAGVCGTIDMILSVMKTHINDIDVCKMGCSVLDNITSFYRKYIVIIIIHINRFFPS